MAAKYLSRSQAIADLSLRRFMGSVRKTYFFCRFDDESSLLATNILRSLIRQCLQAHSLSSKVEHCLSKALRSAIFEPTELSHLLELAIASCTEHYIVIDGIDECSEPERRILIETLGLTVRSSEAPVKLLISSRYGISEGLRRINGHLYNILVDEKKSKLDMATYIDTTLASRLEDGSFRVGDPSLVLYTRTALIAGAQGMYVNPLRQNTIDSLTCLGFSGCTFNLRRSADKAVTKRSVKSYGICPKT